MSVSDALKFSENFIALLREAEEVFDATLLTSGASTATITLKQSMLQPLVNNAESNARFAYPSEAEGFAYLEQFITYRLLSDYVKSDATKIDDFFQSTWNDQLRLDARVQDAQFKDFPLEGHTSTPPFEKLLQMIISAHRQARQRHQDTIITPPTRTGNSITGGLDKGGSAEIIPFPGKPRAPGSDGPA